MPWCYCYSFGVNFSKHVGRKISLFILTLLSNYVGLAVGPCFLRLLYQPSSLFKHMSCLAQFLYIFGLPLLLHPSTFIRNIGFSLHAHTTRIYDSEASCLLGYILKVRTVYKRHVSSSDLYITDADVYEIWTWRRW